MKTMDSGVQMPRRDRHCPRIDTIELKHHIEMKLGQPKAEKYFALLNKYFNLQLSKSEFDKLCIGLLGRQHISLHNGLIRAIIKNACLANAPPPNGSKEQSSLDVKVNVKNGYHNSPHMLKDVFPQSPRKGRTPFLRDRSKSKDRFSPLGPNGKAHIEDLGPKVQEQAEIFSLGSRPPIDVTSEEGEEVEQIAISPGIHSRAPLKAPLGLCYPAKGTRKVLSRGLSSPLIDLETCYNNGELPDTSSLRKCLEQKLAMEGLNVSTYCVNLINSGLDSFLKRLVKPCLDLAAVKKSSVSMTDFQVAIESDRSILGEDWPVILESVAMRASEDYMDG